MKQTKILITGALGQIGAVLTAALQEKYGTAAVIATDIRTPQEISGIFEVVDILDTDRLEAVVNEYGITEIYHLAAILSANGEQQPLQSWDINMKGLFNVLETARRHALKVFFPSSIAVFGHHVSQSNTPQHAPLHPTTVYGISKAAGENWCQYYHEKYGVDIRSLRYPGVIGYQSTPGGGTTDYAVEIFHYASSGQDYTCYLKPDAALPMLYMPDTIKATLQIMEAPQEMIRIRTSYNLAGMTFTPAEIAAAIQAHRPNFSISYDPDFRQDIAASWPSSIDDSAARNDWGWQPDHDLQSMTRDMLAHLDPVAELA